MTAPAFRIRTAVPDDLPAIVGVLAEDEVGGHGDAWSEETAPGYRAAFDEIARDANAEILVACEGRAILGVLILRFERGLAGGGSFRAILQSVFVGAAARGKGVGAAMVAEAERRARARSVARIDLVSNKKRLDAHRFYRRLGYQQSHEGFKKPL